MSARAIVSGATAALLTTIAPAAHGLRAQTSASGVSATFEVASIKPHNAGGRATTTGVQPGRYTATNVTLRTLILNAYRLESFQLAGGPGWLTADHFDIAAKMPAGAPLPSAAPPGDPTPLELMLRSLLADRFQLVMHHESRELPVYALVTARSDKKLGPQMHPTTIDCAAAAAPSTLKEKDGKEKSQEARGSAPSAPKAPGQKPACAMVMEAGRLSASAMTMPALAHTLSGSLQRTVLDHTGLAGAFELRLTWTPDQAPQASAKSDPSKNKGAKIDPNGPSMFTALQEQLGLKLESTKGPVDVLVIDRVEHPTAD